jgi:transposase
MARRTKLSPEVRERAVRMVQGHRADHGSQSEAICSIAAKIGCSAETLRAWIRKTEIASGRRGGATSDDRARLKELEREFRELRRANENLRKASAHFAQSGLYRLPK